MTEPKTYRPEIDGLRALAVLAVLLYHAGGVLTGGFAGVDVFFVISGFVITTVIARELGEGGFSIAAFYERRVRRIVPALFAVIAATTVASYLILLPPDLVSFGKSVIAATLMASNVLFWAQASYFDAAAQAKPLLHTWSLGIEEQFYLVYPLLVALLWRRARGAVVPVLFALFAASLGAAAWTATTNPSAAFYLAPFRFWELLLGGLIALRPVERLQTSWAAAAGVAMVLASYLLYTEETPFPGLPALLPTLGAALVINGARGRSLAARVLGAPPLVFVGKISYSLYLVHWPLIVLVEYRQGAVLDASQAAMVIVSSLALAALSWRFVEQPFRRPAEYGRYRRVFGVAAAAAVAPCVIAVAFLVTKGMPSRLPPQARAVYLAAADKWKDSRKCFVDTKARYGPTPDDIRAGKLCDVGDESRDPTPDFVVWGDSHAGSTAPAIADAADRDGTWGLVVGAGACPPLIKFDVLDAKEAVDERCHETNRAVLDYLRAHRTPVVFLVARWPKYVLGNEYGQEGLFFDPHKVPPPVPGEDVKLSQALDATLAELQKIGVKPVLVMAVPEPGYDVPYAYARGLLTLGKTPDIAPSREVVNGRQKRAREILTAAALKYDGEVVDPNPALCAGASCEVAHDGTPLYSDSDHLTVTAARSISHVFDDLFRTSIGTQAATVR